jgi:hypothetical protein
VPPRLLCPEGARQPSPPCAEPMQHGGHAIQERIPAGDVLRLHVPPRDRHL